MNLNLDTTGIRHIKRLEKWQARVQTKDIELSKCFNTMQEAINWRNSQITPIVLASCIKQDEQCEVLFVKWLASPFIKYSEQTLHLYREAVRLHFRSFFHLKPNEVTPDMILKWINDLREQPTCRNNIRSIKTIKNLLGAFTAFFEWCYLKSLIETNPARDHKMREKLSRIFKMDRISNSFASTIKQKAMTPKEARMLIEIAYKRDFQTGFAIEFFLHTALRLGEVSALNWDDIIQSSGMILISITKTRSHRTLLIQNNAKCGSNGNIELPTAIVRKLDEWKSAAVSMGYDIGPSHSIFPIVARNPHQFSVLIRELGKKCEIHKKISAHSLRHTAITFMTIGGNALHKVQKIARHSTSAMTEAYFDSCLVPVTGVTEAVEKILNSAC
ncbi:MAG: site-specific integrase [Bdellovibrionota bacterium]